MGQTPTPTTNSGTMLPYYGVLFATPIAVTVISVIGISYYIVYPQMRVGISQTPATQGPLINSTAAYESVAKTLTEDERKIIHVLQTHNGKYLQKYIKAETDLSRLQTHRILARLSDRDIVRLEKTGNTNQVALSDWLNKKINAYKAQTPVSAGLPVKGHGFHLIPFRTQKLNRVPFPAVVWS
jgi:hypothetical protein